MFPPRRLRFRDPGREAESAAARVPRSGRNAPRAENANACPACGGTGAFPEFHALDPRPEDAPFILRRCPDCGAGWTEPFVPDDEIGKWYPASYYGKENVRFNPLFEILVRLFRRRRAGVIARRALPGPVLDVGCGRGFLLHQLRSMGFVPHGVELTESGAWHARQKLGLDVRVGGFPDGPHPAGRFHAVVFWHSLEHMSRPLQALRRARELLRPGGLLVVAVPNSDSLQAALFGNAWFHLDIPRHYFHFGARSLRLILEGLGFEIVQLDHFSFEQNPYGWLQSFYNALGFDFNLLYSILKRRSSRAMPVRKRPFQALAILALLPALLPLSLALTVLEAARRQGGTVEIYAVRK